MKLLYLLLIVPALCWGEPTLHNIVEITDIREITAHLSPDTKFVLDLDETTFRHAQILGGRRWVAEHMQQLVKTGMDPQVALDEVIAIFNAVQEHTKMVPMQEHTQAVLREIHDKSFGLLALTARGPEVKVATERHLQDLDIAFKNGIIFAKGSKRKAGCLREYLKSQEQLPKSIVYVDDVLSSLKDVQIVVEEFGIKYYGFHYTHADNHEKDFDYTVAEVQRKWFDLGRGRLYNDEQARNHLAVNDYQAMPAA